MAQWVKDPVLSLQWLGLLLRLGFDPWLPNVHVPWACPAPPNSLADSLTFASLVPSSLMLTLLPP